MSSELAFNAYVFLPNVLNLVENRMQIDYKEQLGATREELEQLHSKMLGPQPNQILALIASLAPSEKTLLIACGTLCLGSMDDTELATTMGLPRSEMEEVLSFIGNSGEDA